MTESDAYREEIQAIKWRMTGVELVVNGIRNIADGVDHFFRPQLEGQLKLMQSREESLAKHQDLDREYAMRELLQATEQVQMMEAQVQQMQQSAANLPEGVKEMVGFMVSMFDHFLQQAKERQRMAQQRVENPDAGIGQVDAEFIEEEPPTYPDGASEYRQEPEA